MVHLETGDFPWSADKLRNKHHPQVINWGPSLFWYSLVFVCELFVLKGLMYYTPQSVEIWEQPLVSQPPAALMCVSLAQEGAKKHTPAWLRSNQ